MDRRHAVESTGSTHEKTAESETEIHNTLANENSFFWAVSTPKLQLQYSPTRIKIQDSQKFFYIGNSADMNYKAIFSNVYQQKPTESNFVGWTNGIRI